jgi:Protein of unknown function (DUF2971)
MITIRQLFSIKPPDLLYHYTTSEGFIGILKSKELWATKIHFMNDSNELRYAIEMTNEEIEIQIDNHDRPRDPVELERMLSELKLIERVNVAVACFSEHGDQLGQWRGYTTNGIGFSLGFESSALANIAKTYPGIFAPCVYTQGDQRDLIKELISITSVTDSKKMKQTFSNNRKLYKGSPFFGKYFISSIFRIASLIKDPAFAEEREWRLVLGPKSYTDAFFRIGPSTLIPYWKISLTSGDAFEPLKKVILGPCPGPKQSLEAAEGYSLSKRLGSIEVDSSSVPFRNW